MVGGYLDVYTSLQEEEQQQQQESRRLPPSTAPAAAPPPPPAPEPEPVAPATSQAAETLGSAADGSENPMEVKLATLTQALADTLEVVAQLRNGGSPAERAAQRVRIQELLSEAKLCMERMQKSNLDDSELAQLMTLTG